MSTQNWIIAAVVVVVIIIAGYFILLPTAESPSTATEPATQESTEPAATE